MIGEYTENIEENKEIHFAKLPPMMVQYWEIKNTYPDHLILFRVGDFFELFYEDAKKASAKLGLTLTKKAYGKKIAPSAAHIKDKEDQPGEIPMCGMPHHIYLQYCYKLVMLNYKIVVCDQMETPEQAKSAGRSVVQRQITKILTKSTIFYENEGLDLENHFLISVIQLENRQYNLLICDIATSDYYYKFCDGKELHSFIRKISPEEILISKHDENREYLSEQLKEWRDKIIIWTPQSHLAIPSKWEDYLSKCSLKEIANSHSILSYLKAHGIDVSPQSYPQPFPFKEYVSLDSKTIGNLHLIKDTYDQFSNDKSSNLVKNVFQCLDMTSTPMGKRYLKHLLLFPSTSVSTIQERQNKVQFFLNLLKNQGELGLSGIGDVEKSLSQCLRRKIPPIMLVRMAKGLKKIINVLGVLQRTNYPDNLNYQCYAADLILNTMEDEEHVENNMIIQSSHVPILQEYRHQIYGLEQTLKSLLSKYTQQYSVNNIKIKKDQRSGDFMEAPKSQEKQLGSNRIFSITQSNITSVKFTSEEFLRICEERNKIHQKIDQVTNEILKQLIDKVEESFTEIQQIVRKIAEIDVYLSFAKVALQYKYTCPVVDNSNLINIKNGYHIIASRNIQNFVPNSLNMDGHNYFHIITGPNMGGKSTFLRQNAVIVILAQIGAFVPAEKAHLGVVDNIFTRIGAGDDLISGQSTFMMEMQEMAHMLKGATNKSLMIIDELGRGTSVKEGCALSTAVIEYIAQHIHCRCIFSTHFHSIANTISSIPSIRFFHVGYMLRHPNTPEEQLIFTYEIKPEVCSESFGIHVAKIAGLPEQVIARSRFLVAESF